MLWKIYLWVGFAIMAMSYGSLIATGATWLDWLDIGVFLVSVLGLVGFAYSIPIGRQGFWRVWFFLAVLWDPLFNVVLSSQLGWAQQPVGNLGAVAYLVALPFLMPLYIALFLYGYRRPALWTPTERSEA